MGIGWLFGFAASFSDKPELWWIFILITSYHGVYMFIVVCCGSILQRRLWKKRPTEITSNHRLIHETTKSRSSIPMNNIKSDNSKQSLSSALCNEEAHQEDPSALSNGVNIQDESV